jgi:WD40 repeat protein
VKIWDADNGGKCLYTLEGHANAVSSVVFSHNSTRLASASWDETVKIWDVDNGGKCLHTFKDHSNWVNSVAFSQDSTRLASASGDKTVKIWDTSSGKCLHTLEIGKILFHISFDLVRSYLRTDIGTIVIGKLFARNEAASVRVSQNLKHKGVGLCPNSEWITYNSKKMLWLPPEFRPSCSVVSGKTIAIGTGSGKVWTGVFDIHDS